MADSTDEPTDNPPPETARAANLADLQKSIFPNYPNEEQIARFFDVLGRAVTVWQLVETALYEVYERALLPERPGACGAAFHAIQTFNIKLAATDAAVRFCLAGDKTGLLDQWEKVRANADKKSKRRNEFVHFSTYIMFNEENENDQIRLEPQVYDWRYVDGVKPSLRISEISSIGARFQVVADELKKFKDLLPGIAREKPAAPETPLPEFEE